MASMDYITRLKDLAIKDLERAKSARARAEATLRSVEAEVIRLQHFLQQCELYAKLSAGETSTVTARVGRTKEMVDKVIAILSERKRPHTIAELTQELRALGLEIAGEKPKSNLAAYLSRDHRIEFVQGIGWLLTDWIRKNTQDDRVEGSQRVKSSYTTEEIEAEFAKLLGTASRQRTGPES